MFDWRKVTGPLWVLSALWLGGAIVVVVNVHGPAGAIALYPLLMLAWIFFLLKGVRWVWFATLGVNILGSVPLLIAGSFTPLGGVVTLATVLLLLLPETRRYFAKAPVAAAA